MSDFRRWPALAFGRYCGVTLRLELHVIAGGLPAAPGGRSSQRTWRRLGRRSRRAWPEPSSDEVAYLDFGKLSYGDRLSLYHRIDIMVTGFGTGATIGAGRSAPRG